jgi:pseudaminic acid biosynthesis-associated methylase
MSFSTNEEAFWAGSFGNDYIERNRSQQYLASNIHFFSNILRHTQKVESVIEFGANIGMNLRALKIILPHVSATGIEINAEAVRQLQEVTGQDQAIHQSILDYIPEKKHDLSLIKGVLIHIHPEKLTEVYAKLYESTKKYILICEYYNPTPVEINYRGHEGKLYKRDFAGEMLDQYKDLVLSDYGFVYRRDVQFPQDDITWFLLTKQ